MNTSLRRWGFLAALTILSTITNWYEPSNEFPLSYWTIVILEVVVPIVVGNIVAMRFSGWLDNNTWKSDQWSMAILLATFAGIFLAPAIKMLL